MGYKPGSTWKFKGLFTKTKIILFVIAIGKTGSDLKKYKNTKLEFLYNLSRTTEQENDSSILFAHFCFTETSLIQTTVWRSFNLRTTRW